MGQDPYDIVAYDARPVRLAHPAAMAAAAIATGRDVVPLGEARVLELGAANGAHLLPIAVAHPGASFVAVERSSAQAGAAKSAADALGLDNLDVVTSDVLDVDVGSLGEVDYLIVHGVFSWVPEPVRARILEIAGLCLSPRGLLFLSYNSPPGWDIRGALRHALRAIAPDDLPPRERVGRAREGLELLASTLGTPASEFASLLASAIPLAQRSSDSHLLHEYLAPHNRAFSLGEVLERALPHGLGFVREVGPLSQDGVREAHVRQTLAAAGLAPAATTVFTDLILERQFRQTLLAKGGASGELEPGRAIERCHLSALLHPASELVLDDGVECRFVTPGETSVMVTRRVDKVALLELWDRWPGTLTFPHLLGRIRQRISGDLDDASVSALEKNLASLAELGHLRTWTESIEPARPTSRPWASALTRIEAERYGWVTTAHHEHLDLDPFDRRLLREVDGERPLPALAEAMIEAVALGELRIYHQGQPMADGPELRHFMPGLVARSASRLTTVGVLRDPP